MSKINSFIDYASDILGDTDKGISTSQIISICNRFSAEYNVNIPHTRIYQGFSQTFSNKRTALKENLLSFSEEGAFKVIEHICNLNHYKEDVNFKEVKIKLYTNFPKYVDKNDNENLNIEIIENKELLSNYPKAKKMYDDACSLYNIGIYERNIIDNLRLSLELIIKQILNNEKSLENNLSEICSYLRDKGCSQEFINMFRHLLDYYSKYNNNNVKHNDNINNKEIDFVFGLTNLYIKLLVKEECDK